MNTSLNTSLSHFLSSQTASITAAAEAVSKGDWGSLGNLIDRVSQSKAAEAVTNLVNSSSDAFKTLQSKFKPEAFKFLFGAVLSGMGGCMLVEAAGLAAAIGISVMSTYVIACLLILWGLSIAFPAVWNMTLEKLKKAQNDWLSLS